MDKIGWNHVFNRRTAGTGHRCALVRPINRIVALGARLVAGIARVYPPVRSNPAAYWDLPASTGLRALVRSGVKEGTEIVPRREMQLTHTSCRNTADAVLQRSPREPPQRFDEARLEKGFLASLQTKSVNARKPKNKEGVDDSLLVKQYPASIPRSRSGWQTATAAWLCRSPGW